MVFTILIGAQFFSLVFRLLHGEAMIQDFFLGLQLNKFIIVFFIMAIMFVLGFFLDFLEICFIIIPIIMPILTALGFNTEQNLLYLAILIAINLQTSFLTPPFGFSLFYLKGVTPPEIKTIDIYRGVIPFVVIQLVVLVILAALPNLILWLPTVVFK
jgi:TRAP-type mannitol/chloroaromatic compound transport system permease large subunit